MKHVFAITSIAIAVLVACSSNEVANPTVTVVSQAQKFVGLLEVRVNGIGEMGNPTSSARFINPASLKSGLNAKTITVEPVNGTNALNDIQIINSNVTFTDDDRATPAQRYINSSFELINRKSSPLYNLSLYAVNVPGTTIGGTAIAAIRTAAGTAITDISVPRSFKPTHGIKQNLLNFETNPSNADLQLFTPTEVNNPTNGV
jgi:hypothetical protein